jgi:hypothetical protein
MLPASRGCAAGASLASAKGRRAGIASTTFASKAKL